MDQGVAGEAAKELAFATPDQARSILGQYVEYMPVEDVPGVAAEIADIMQQTEPRD